MRELILARHGESEASAAGVMSGDPAVAVPLTATGREQARLLGEALRGERVDLCVVTEHRRTRETAAIALAAYAAGRGGAAHDDERPEVPLLVLSALNDVRAGAWEGKTLSEYRTWALVAGPAEPCPGGGESRAQIAARIAGGVRELLGRPEERLLLVAHGLPLRYLLDATAGLVPAPRAASVPYAAPFRLDAEAVAAAAALLERWAAAPAWRST